MTKFLDEIFQFEFLVLTEKNIFAYKLFLLLIISNFNLLFFLWKWQPVKSPLYGTPWGAMNLEIDYLTNESYRLNYCHFQYQFTQILNISKNWNQEIDYNYILKDLQSWIILSKGHLGRFEKYKRAFLSLFPPHNFLEKYLNFYIIYVKINMQKLNLVCGKYGDVPWQINLYNILEFLAKTNHLVVLLISWIFC